MTEPIVPVESVTREAASRRLRELVPPLVRDGDGAPSRSGALKSIDEEFARLAYDSDRDATAAAGVRTVGSSVRVLSFEAPGLALDVEVTKSRPREVFCQVVPAQPSYIEVVSPSGVVAVCEDDYGTFHIPSVSPGPVQLRCRPLHAGQSLVATSWMRI